MKKREYEIDSELTDKQWKRLEHYYRNRSDPPKADSIPSRIGLVWRSPLTLPKRGEIQRHAETFSFRQYLLATPEMVVRTGSFARSLAEILGLLDEKSQLKWEDGFGDVTFAPAKGGRPLGRRKREKARK